MPISETDFLNNRQAFRDALRSHSLTFKDAFEEVAVANEQLSQHRADQNNPHGVEKGDVGLAQVENRAPATTDDITDFVNLDRLINPATLKQMIQDPRMLAGSVINAVRTPRPVSPIESATIASTQEVTLVADQYRHMYSREIATVVQRIPRQTRDFEIYSVATGDLVWSDTVDADQIVSPFVMERTAAYRWRCRDISIDGETGPWSAFSRFHAPDSTLVTPTVSFPDGITTVTERPVINASAFQTVGDSDIHQSTTWRIFNLNAASPSWEVVETTTELESITVPGGILNQNADYQLEVIYNSVGAGSVSSGRIQFRTMERFPFTPGPVALYWGDDTLGYYGEIPAASFITGDQLSVLTGFSGGQSTPWSASTPWIKIQLDGKVAYVPKYPIRYGFLGADMDIVGLTNDGKEITISQTVYRVRNLQGLVPGTTVPLDTTTTNRLGQFPDNDPVLTANSEWNRVMSMILTWLQIGNDHDQIGLTSMYRHNVAAEYPTDDSAAPLVIRGNGTFATGDSRALTYVSKSADAFSLATPEHVTWRPVLLLVSD